MNEAMKYLSENWWWILIAIGVAVQILQATTRHFSEQKGLVKVLTYITELLGIFKSTGVPGILKAPLSSSPPTHISTKPPMLPIIGPLIFLISLALTGCGMTTLQKFNAAGTLVDRSWKRIYPLVDKHCRSEAKKCRKEGIKTDLKDCPEAAKCLKGLKAFAATLDTADAAITIGLPLALKGDKTNALSWLKVALDALTKAAEVARAYSFLPISIK